MSRSSIKLDTNYPNLKYDITGVTEEEIQQLMTEFDPADYEGYKGVCYPFYTLKGTEVILYMADKYEAILLEDYQKIFHPPDTDTAPFKLNDGRIMVLGAVHAVFYKNDTDYFNCISNRGRLFNQKRIPEKDFPFKRIEYLPNDQKIYYQEISPAFGEILKKKYFKMMKEYQPKSKPRADFYMIGEHQILEYHSGFNYYFLYQQTDFERLIAKWDLIKESERPDKRGMGMIGPLHRQRPMWGRNPYGEDFVKHTKELAKKLPPVLNLPPELLTEDAKGFAYIQRYILANLITDEFADQVFLPLLAYMGNYLVDKGAKWELSYDEYGQTWVPDVSYKEKKRMIYMPILKILDSRDTYVGYLPSLYGFVRKL